MPTYAAVDAHYADDATGVACVLFRAPSDAAPARELSRRLAAAAPYEPGRFYLRELPALRAILADAGPVDIVLVDGHAWLAPGVPGLGAHLHDAIGVPVVGVAKTAYRGSPHAVPVVRGQSTRPLLVTAAGLDAAEAGRLVAAMHGAHRVPTLIRRVDALARAALIRTT